jgi:DNA polymerase I-like protein with 3'-5' exonuclease and polymerase domains
MAFSFGNISATSDKKLQSKIEDKVLVYEELNDQYPYYLILLDHHETDRKISAVTKFFKKYIHNFRIVYSSKVTPSTSNIKGGIAEFYRKNKTDWKEFLEAETMIISVGSSIYSLADDDLQVSYFYDFVTNPRTFFFDPKSKCWVFPIDSMFNICTFGQSLNPYWNTYKANFAIRQLNESARQYESLMNDREIDKVNLIQIHDSDHFVKILNEHKRYKLICYDLETSGLSHFRDKIGVLTFSFDGETGYIVPWSVLDKQAFNEFLKDRQQLGANLKFDTKFLWKAGITNASVHEDTHQLGHVLNEIRSNSLKTHSYIYTKHGGYEAELEDFKRNTGIEDYNKIPFEVLAKYATMDAIVTFQVWKKMRAQLAWVDQTFPNEKNDWYTMTNYYEDIMMRSLRAFNRMEYRGIHVNMNRMESARKILNDKIKSIQNKLAETLGNIDFNSTQALGKRLKEKGWKSYGESKAGFFSTGDEQLEHWVLDGHQEALLLQDLRSSNTLLSTFIGKTSEDGWGKYLNNYEDGSWRMCAQYSHMTADSGRSKCRNPNLQQIPANDDLIPKCIDVPSEDYVFLSADQSSLQVRLAGIDAKDSSLKNVYGPGKHGDFHSLTAFNIFAKDKVFIKLTDDSGKVRYFGEYDNVQIKRGNGLQVIKVKDLDENDTIVD